MTDNPTPLEAWAHASHVWSDEMTYDLKRTGEVDAILKDRDALLREIERLRGDVSHANDFLIRHGYRFCDIAACNCGSWHGGHANKRLAELREAFEQDELTETNGKTLLKLVCETLGDRAHLRAEVEALREFAKDIRMASSMKDVDDACDRLNNAERMNQKRIKNDPNGLDHSEATK